MKNFYEYLKKALLIHIITGISAGLGIGFLIFTHYYKNTMEKALYTIKNNLSKAQVIRDEDEALKKKIELLKSYLPKDYKGKETELLILEKIDRIKTLFPSSRLTVTEFQPEGDSLSIGFALQGSIEDYRDFVNRINLLEGSSLPLFIIDKLLINVQPDGNNSFQINGRIKTVKMELL
ncbi:MAG: hypothetical protein ACK4TF_03980 [Thermodesulfovibrionales bacterium]